ncbi:ER-bound oxygenase mpaB' [Exophiala dermatitidis]
MAVILLAIAVVLGYVTVVSAVRFRRRDSLSTRYPYHDRASLARMTVDDAFDIQLPLAELEFPTTFSFSVFFALFKTYGIPSISKLLVATGQLSDFESSSKRAADTGVLVSEFVLNRPGSDRNLDAIARMNWLHDRYRKSGKIKDEDMLYTLSLFVLEPLRWTRRFEWRNLSDIEICAMAVYWKSVGEMMNIPYDALLSAKPGWRDGLHWLEEVESWSRLYEIQHTVPDKNNRTLALATIAMALTNVPYILHGLGLQVVAALLDRRLRQAMLLEEPQWPIQMTLEIAVLLRKYMIRFFFLPRPEFFRVSYFTATPDPLTKRYHTMQYIGHPWYIKPSLARRWNINSWLLWLSGGYIPSTHDNRYHPEGYRIPEVGPASLAGQGVDEMLDTRVRILRTVKSCPFSPQRKSS